MAAIYKRMARAVSHKLKREPFVMRVRELASEPFIMFQRNRGCGLYDQVVAVCQRAGFSPRVIQEAVYAKGGLSCSLAA